MKKLSLKKLLLSLAGAATALFMAAGISVSANAEESATIYSVEYDGTYCQTDCRKMLDLVNEFRTGDDAWYWNEDNSEKVECGELSELTYDYNLEKIAMQRAAECAIYYSHTRPNGGSCFDVYDEYNYPLWSVGENIAVGQASYSSVFTAWKEDNYKYSGQGHRRNMLDSDYNRIGIAGVYYAGRWYWVMELAKSNSKFSSTDANDNLTTLSVEVADSTLIAKSLTAGTSKVEVNLNESTDLPSLTSVITTGSYNKNILVRPEYTYSFSDSSIANISNGKIYGLKAGTTILTISALGTSTSITVTVNSVEVNPAVEGYSLSLLEDGSSDVNIYISTPADKLDNTIIRIAMNDASGSIISTNEYSCKDYVVAYENATGIPTYKIPYEMSVTDMDKSIEIIVYYYSEIKSEKSMVIADYLYECINQSVITAEQKNLCVALLNYGAAVQKYFNGNTDNLVNEKLTSDQQEITLITKDTVENYIDTGIQVKTGSSILGIEYLGLSLVLDNVSGLNLRLYMSIDYTKCGNITFSTGENTLSPVNVGDCYYVDVPVKIGSCSDMGVLQIARSSYGSTDVSVVNTGVYSYVNTALNMSNPKASLIELVSALYKLNELAK